jgi:hypothetical protein
VAVVGRVISPPPLQKPIHDQLGLVQNLVDESLQDGLSLKGCAFFELVNFEEIIERK